MVRNFALAMLILFNSTQAEKEEETNPIHCSYGSFRCADNSGCVLGKELCDYDKNCNDFSDEGFSLCKKLHEGRGSCDTPGEYSYGYRGCEDISKICSGEDDQYRSICEEIKNGLQPNEEFLAMQEISILREKISAIRNETELKDKQESNLKSDVFEHLSASFNQSIVIRNDSVCPPLYVNISGKCMSLFSVAKLAWAEAEHFCVSISGQLAVLGDMKDYVSLLKHLKGQGLTTDFWVGGQFAYSKSLKTSAWKWLDEQDIALGAPYWSLYQTPNCTTRGSSPVCYSYSLAPREHRDGFCLALDYAFHYYFTDQNCHEKRSPLCILNEE